MSSTKPATRRWLRKSSWERSSEVLIGLGLVMLMQPWSIDVYSYGFTVMLAGWEGIPFATTSSVLAPVSAPEGTSKLVDTIADPVATPIVLWSCVLA